MFMKKPGNRIFDYTPRYYQPENDNHEKMKRRLGFSRKAKSNRKRKNPIIWVILVILVILTYLKLMAIAGG